MSFDFSKTAKRMKELRESKGLSHERLFEQLSKDEIEISRSSLKNYEVSEPENHTRAGAVKGMSIEKLCGLCDFYGVSADYILGRSDIEVIDPKDRELRQYTGLSQKAIENLKKDAIKGFDQVELHSVSMTDTINAIVASDEFPYIVKSFYDCLSLSSVTPLLAKRIADKILSSVNKSEENGRKEIAKAAEFVGDMKMSKYDTLEAFGDMVDRITGYKNALDLCEKSIQDVAAYLYDGEGE